MRYQVPQFLDIEDKILGPLTFKQALYIGGGIGALIMGFVLISPRWLGIAIGLPMLALGLALAFYKVNNKPFIFILQSMITYLIGDKLFTWKKRTPTKNDIKTTNSNTLQIAPPPQETNRITPGHLRELSWKLDTQTDKLQDEE